MDGTCISPNASIPYPTSSPTQRLVPGYSAQNPKTKKPHVAIASGRNMVGSLSSASASPMTSCRARRVRFLSDSTWV